MVDTDLPEFTTLLDSVCALLSRGQYTPSDASTILFFRKLTRYAMADVRRALDLHVERSKFPPTPAEIIDILSSSDGRPETEEAWAIATQSRDERASVVWTQEIAEAWDVARHAFARRDEIGARMAFKEVYPGLVAEARRAGRPHTWLLSEGFDQRARAEALRIAASAGRIVHGAEHLIALPAPDETPLLLAGPDIANAPPEARERLLAVRERLTAQSSELSADAAARARTAELQREAAAKVDAYLNTTATA